MMPTPPKLPRGPLNELHQAAMRGFTERINSVLTRGVININQGDPTGRTPLMCAAQKGCMRVVGILLNKGANDLAEDHVTDHEETRCGPSCFPGGLLPGGWF
ncbi:unnamed protein product [Ectocarpus sp. CCAP 1310/34]|nr:unnamed protein product [Ectocarpus sp. CCAP 1310/34]